MDRYQGQLLAAHSVVRKNSRWKGRQLEKTGQTLWYCQGLRNIFCKTFLEKSSSSVFASDIEKTTERKEPSLQQGRLPLVSLVSRVQNFFATSAPFLPFLIHGPLLPVSFCFYQGWFKAKHYDGQRGHGHGSITNFLNQGSPNNFIAPSFHKCLVCL